MDMFGQFGAGEGLSNAIVADVGNLAQPVQQTERMQDASINADTDIGVASFDSLKRGAGREGAFGHDRHGEPSTAAGIMNVRAEFAQRPPYRSWWIMRSGHM
jgi:hypothetical protein